MSYNIIVQTEAILDIQAAFEWYEEAKDGLGFDLINEIETCYHKISIHPQHYGFTTRNYRSIRTRRFPYQIIFEIIDDKIFVYGFFHCKRKGKK
ncbi:type II toxin-antitoxin system RelE/ParE family toxin [Segetibacter aerophilus]|uniref:Toxin, RelE family protein n=1 Tax=Segetibacter aerophilus TaxID=670293 RepID=A0A512BIC2_9BACT|nr:type II toxin-antitoxin system RelE/ParE family toxin [Segetibacter aerophilus]GEO11729.1 toxin, RelE family protein [Segetibacter aerophilus]